ncbi:hypothetical protein NBZ79_02720 [Sneathiella marina]|uniref:DUF429 domain-containing protein n=1 Tax=Sneathiella marina TaxID=2950108 RepID=A0ABY4WB42_9PROT|nr:hypothetical protein [Sneathiella marina]USG61886.1 hypothetical protein NBZ79_02720 [Sneathiella marina]
MLRPEPEYFRTRAACMSRIRELLKKYSGTALIGFDFPFGYPFNCGIGGGLTAAQKMSSILYSDLRDANNRFEAAAILNKKISPHKGPFWGCPTAFKSEQLSITKPPFQHQTFQEWRIVERYLKEKKFRIMNVWQLMGRGSVGSQTLTGLKALHDLHLDANLKRSLKFWPFNTKWNHDLDGIILTEVWPSLNDLAAYSHPVKDARQVLACRDWILDHDAKGTLRNLFNAPKWLSVEDRQKCEQEEGWILGV